jgi:hypothetical protein
MDYYEDDFIINLGKARGGGKGKKNKRDCKKNKEVNVYNSKFVRNKTEKQLKYIKDTQISLKKTNKKTKKNNYRN